MKTSTKNLSSTTTLIWFNEKLLPKKNFNKQKILTFLFQTKFQTKKNKSQQPTGGGKQCRSSSSVVNIFSLSNFLFLHHFFSEKNGISHTMAGKTGKMFSSKNNGWLNFWLSFFLLLTKSTITACSDKQTIQDSKTKMDIIIGNHCYMTKNEGKKKNWIKIASIVNGIYAHKHRSILQFEWIK